MELKDIKDAIDGQNRAFEEFKRTNDERLKQIETRGVADPLLQVKLDKINADLTKSDELLSQQVQDVQATVNRLAVAGSGPGMSPEAAGRKSAFWAYVRKGLDRMGVELKAHASALESDGGFLTPPEMAKTIYQAASVISPVRQVANVITTLSDAYEGVASPNLPSAGWVSEQASRAATSTVTLQKYRIQVHELEANPQATQTWLDDAVADVEGWLTASIAEAFAKTQGTAFVAGTGVNSPRGFTTYSTAATADATRTWGTIEHVATGTSGTLGTDPNGLDKMISLVSKFAPRYLPTAKWAMNRATAATVRAIKANSMYAWAPALAADAPATLLGFPVVIMDDIPALAANSLSVWLADWKSAYTIVDRVGMRVIRDGLTNKPYIGFYTTVRVGGDVVDFNAIKCLKAA